MKRIKASMTVEAVLIMPVIILLFAMFLTAFKSGIGFMLVREAMIDTADTIADYAFLYEMSDLETLHNQLVLDEVYSMLAAEIMKERLSGKNLQYYGVQNGADGLGFSHSKALYPSGNRQALFCLTVQYMPRFLGSSLLDLKPISMQVVTHAFLGSNPFDSYSDTANLVYQIGEGEKYHRLNCMLIEKDIQKMPLWTAQKNGLTACNRCRSWEGQDVYVSSGGSKYHQKGCTYLYPNVIAVEYEKALEKGLTPCALCHDKS